MKTLYFECNMGAAGDMLMAALLELLPDRQAFLDQMNGLGLPGVRVSAAPSVKCGITGTHVSVTVHGEEEEGHHHDHDRHHSDLHGITHIIEDFDLPDKVKADALAVYRLIAEAESHAHGRPVEHIHFHEVGTLDAIADITGVCLAIHLLALDRILASPVHVGSGQVRCAHGILPVPAPATAHILRDAPIYGGKIQGELCTPTGAALLKHFASSFGEMPMMRAARIGYGMGKKDFEAANCVRAFFGETEAGSSGEILELCCNLDDMTGEAIGFAQERLLESGALEVFTTAVGMKKSRPGVLLTCLCRLEQREDILRLLFLHTTTLGVRETVCTKYMLDRSQRVIETGNGPVRVKTAQGFGVTREKLEYEDIAALARKRGVSLREMERQVWEADHDD